ncbi:unnamed protein product [Schistosoma spindalis]|nr:unnamed protein product [Schistosoma spindale]
MNYLDYLFILLFIINFSSLSIENPILTEITTPELSHIETESSVVPVNRLVENSTEFYNVEDLGSTGGEEWNSNITGTSSSFGSVSDGTVPIYQEELNFTTSEKYVSITSEYVTENDTSTFQLEDQKTEEPETENNDIVTLLDSLLNKLKVPSENWLNYHYIMAMQSPDGSIYVPKNHTQSTRKHLITLLGFAEEIVSNKDGITYVNNKNRNHNNNNHNNTSEEKLPITTQWINENILILNNNTSIIEDNQSNIDYGTNITDNSQEFLEIDDEMGTFTEISNLFTLNTTEREEVKLVDYALHNSSNDSNDLHEIMESITSEDVDRRIPEQNHHSSTWVTDDRLSNITNDLHINNKQDNITTDSMDHVNQQRIKLNDNETMII